MTTNKDKVTVFFSNDCSNEQKYTTARFFKHLDFDKVSKNGQVKGFSYPIDDFNKVVLNGCTQQRRKTCKATQTDQRDLQERPTSPSVFSKEFRKM